MKFLIDAQLPRRMCKWFSNVGVVAIHTLDLPARNSTPDDDVARAAEEGGYVVLSKDADFVDSHLLSGVPKKFLLISTGNISNDELEVLIVPLISHLVREFQTCNFVELTRNGLIVRG